MGVFSLIILLVFGLQEYALGQYIVPEPTIEIFHPKGFSVSIPDDGEIKLFAFHGKINEEFEGREAGTFARDITKPKDGKWTFTDKSTRFKVGDVLYYWLYVINKEDNLGYLREDESYTVTSLPKNGNQPVRGGGNKPVIPPPTIPTPRPTTTTGTPSVCNETPTKVNGANSCSGSLIFSEDFNDINKWQAEVRFAGEPDYEFVTYISDLEQLYVKNNEVHFKPVFADEKFNFGFVRLPQGLNLGLKCTGATEYDCNRQPLGSNILPPVFSARINSKPSFSFLYGKVEVRAKLPKGNWIYPEIYLTPKKYAYGAGLNSGEMRVAFTLGNNNLNNELSGGLILGSDHTGRTYAIKKTVGNVNWSDDYHIFGLEWRRDRVTLTVDNQEYGNIYPPPGGYGDAYKSEVSEKWKQGDVLAPFDQEMVITLGVGVGGHAIPDLEGKPYKNEDAKEMLNFYQAKNSYLPTWQQDTELIVDYVKVYAL